MSTTTEELKSALANYYGTEQWFKHPFTKMTYTEGVQAFAQTAGAYWLLDKIALEIYHTYSKKYPFISITLKVSGNKAVLLAGDGNGTWFYERAITYTDCPAGEWDFFLQNDVLMLVSEY